MDIKLMKKTTVFYWIFTGMLIPALGIGSVSGLFSSPESVQVITALNYPAYIVPFLSLARLLALLVIFLPKLPRLKEWAYAGLVFDVIGAMYSQIALENPLKHLIFPLIALVFIFGSYFFYHKKLKMIEKSKE